MATDAEEQGSSPRIKFRWCRTVPVQTREVHLILTSVTGARIALQWKNELGWYESELVSLPCGLHFGFLLIREKVRPSFLHPDSARSTELVDERDYKIDPFFVSAHKYSVELFVQSDRTLGVWKDNLFLKDRYLSSPHLDTQRDSDSKEDGSIALSSRRWQSHQELRKSVCWEADDKKSTDQKKTETKSDAVSSQSLQTQTTWTEDEAGKSKWTSRGSSSGIGLWEGGEEGILSPHGVTSLRKWSSLGEKGGLSHRTSPDSFYCSRSRSLQTEIELQAKRNENDTFELAPSKSEGTEVNIPSHSGFVKTVTAQSDAEFFNKLKTDTLARVQAVESLLKQSDDEADEGEDGSRVNLYFKEVNPSRNEGYGCLITFESRSTSMDDLGSPRALEEVLVSLTSSDTDPKPYPSISAGGTETVLVEAHKEIPYRDQVQKGQKSVESEREYSQPDSETSTQSQVGGDEDELNEPWRLSSKEEDRYPESDITINEDENFQYDSLNNEDQNIPLNIKAVLDSENSSEYSSLNVGSKTVFVSGRSAEGENIGVANSDGSDTPRDEINFDHDDNENGNKVHSYDLLNRKVLPSSARGAVATDPLVLVHPGSLRSDTVTESRKSSDTLKEAVESSKPPRRSHRKVGDQEPLLKNKDPSTAVGNGSNAPPRMTSKDYEKTLPLRKAKKSSSLSKTILIIRDRKNPRMNSTGTQTTYRDSPTPKFGRAMANQSLPTSSNYKDKSLYSPLPDKINGPWTTKYGNERTSDSYPYFENSNIRNLQKNLYNIAKADRILKKIHPFDYRPTLIHTNNLSRISHSESLRSSTKRALKSPKSVTVARDSQTAHKTYSPPLSVPAPFKPYLSCPTCSRFSVHKRDESDMSHISYTSPLRLKRVPKPYFSIYGKEIEDSNGERCPDHYRGRSLGSRPLNYQFHSRSSFALGRSATAGVGEPTPIRPTASLPDLRGTRDEVSCPFYYRQFRGKGPVRAYSSPPVYTRDYDAEKMYFASPPIQPHIRRRSSYDDHVCVSGSSSGSTDSLLKEAEDATRNYIRGSRTASRIREETSRFPWQGTQSFAGVTGNVTGARNPPVTTPYKVTESSVADCLRARSEADLRLIGNLVGGRQGEPPYLPYNRRELSLGQIVKVLVPGEGVAMARVVYNPALDYPCLRRFPVTNQDITVVLISEPTNLSGSVITIPLSKVLLAWPKV